MNIQAIATKAIAIKKKKSDKFRFSDFKNLYPKNEDEKLSKIAIQIISNQLFNKVFASFLHSYKCNLAPPAQYGLF